MERGWVQCRRLLVVAVLLSVVLLLGAIPGGAMNIVEAWRVPFPSPSAVCVYPTDGSCVFTSGGAIVRLDQAGNVIQQIPGTFTAVGANTKDGSCWATDKTNGTLTHFAAGGANLWSGNGYHFGAWDWTRYLDVDPGDGSVWFGDSEYVGGTSTLYHLAADGSLLWSGSSLDISSVSAVSVNSSDGSCWVASTEWFLIHGLTHFAADGTELFHTTPYRPLAVSANSSDGSVWYPSSFSPAGSGLVFHAAADGTSLWQGTEVPNNGSPYAVAVNPRDGACWVLDGTEFIYHAADGTVRWRAAGYGIDYWHGGAISVSAKDGSVRISDTGNGYVIRLNVQKVPQAYYEVAKTTGQAPFVVPFENWSLGTPATCLWEFGDGATSNDYEPTHRYTRPGTYTVKLTASNGCGTSSCSGAITVLPTQSATRLALFWFSRPVAVRAAFLALTGDADGVLPVGSCYDVTPEDAMAVFWRGTTPRALLARQILAADFNNALLKPAPAGVIQNAETVLCNPASTGSQISAAWWALEVYNLSGSLRSILGYDFGPVKLMDAMNMASQGSIPGGLLVR